MNTTKIIFLVLMFCTLQPMIAQDIKKVQLKGRILSEQTRLPLENATITITSVSDTKNGASVTSDINGEFEIQTEAGIYAIRIDLTSFKSVLLDNRQINQDFNLGDLFLEDDFQLLKAVNIAGEKTGTSLNLDTRTFYVGKDIMSKGGNANDILSNVPSVSVDNNGTVSLRGNAGVRVVINGKPSVMSMNNGLEQIPASQIEKVEVITNPSAKYESQGAAGIINIVLKKNTLYGLNGSVQAGAGDPANYNGNINLSYKKEKFNLFTNVGVRFRKLDIKEDKVQTTFNNGEKNTLLQSNTTDRRDRNYNFYIGGDYYFNTRNTLTGSFYHSTLILNNHIEYNYDYYNADHTIDTSIYRFEHYKEPKKYNQLELNYVKTSEEKDKSWTTSLQYDFWNDDENQNITQRTVFPNESPDDNLITRNIESSNDIFIQSDYVKTKDNSKLETGVRGNFRAIRSDYLAQSNGLPLPEYNNKLNYDENLIGAYLQWGDKINKWSYLLGIRAEMSLIGISDRVGTFTQDKHYTDFFPTLHLGYKLQESIDLQLSYSRRINRPEFWQLNPFGGLSDLRNLTIGNPDLDPTYTHSIEFSLLKKVNKFTITPAIYYKHTTNYFQYVLKQTQDGNFLRTPINLDYEERYGLEVSGTYKPLNWWNLTFNFNYYGFNQKGNFEGKEYKSQNKMWNTQINSRMKLPENLTIESMFSYRGKYHDIQSLNKPVYRLNIAVSKDILKEKMTIAVAFNNILNSLIERQELHTNDYQLQSTNYGVGRMINLTIAYRFNRKKGEKDRLPDEN